MQCKQRVEAAVPCSGAIFGAESDSQTALTGTPQGMSYSVRQGNLELFALYEIVPPCLIVATVL